MEWSHVAVATNISTRLAFVINASTSEKTVVKAATIPRRIDMLHTKYRTTVDEIERSDDTTVPQITRTVTIVDSE